MLSLRFSNITDPVDETAFTETEQSDTYDDKNKKKRFPFYNHPSEKGNEIGIEGGLPYGLARHTWDEEFSLPEVQTPRQDTSPYFDESSEIELKEREPETMKYPSKDIMKRSPWFDFTEQNLNTNGGKMETLSFHNLAPQMVEKAEHLGQNIASDLEWRGDGIVVAFLAALEDANFHTFRQQVEDLWKNYEVSNHSDTQIVESRVALKNEALDDNHADLDKDTSPIDLEVLDDAEIKNIFDALGPDYINLEIDLTASKMEKIFPEDWKKDKSSIEVVGRSLARRLQISREAGISLVKRGIQETPTYPIPTVPAAPGHEWVWSPDSMAWEQKPLQDPGMTGVAPQY